jgi:hypothetical protein
MGYDGDAEKDAIKEKEEDSELDSLDGYLHEFRERSVEASGTACLMMC